MKLRNFQVLLFSLFLAVFAGQASAMFIQPDWLDPTEAGGGTNRHAYSGTDPINKFDNGGNAWTLAVPPAVEFAKWGVAALIGAIGLGVATEESGVLEGVSPGVGTVEEGGVGAAPPGIGDNEGPPSGDEGIQSSNGSPPLGPNAGTGLAGGAALSDFFSDGQLPKASELADWAES